MRCSNLKVLVWRTSPLHDGSVHDANLSGYEDRAEAFRRNHDKYIQGTFEHFPKLERLEHTKLPHELQDPDPYQIFEREQPGGRILGLMPASSRPDDSEAAERLQAHADNGHCRRLVEVGAGRGEQSSQAVLEELKEEGSAAMKDAGRKWRQVGRVE